MLEGKTKVHNPPHQLPAFQTPEPKPEQKKNKDENRKRVPLLSTAHLGLNLSLVYLPNLRLLYHAASTNSDPRIANDSALFLPRSSNLLPKAILTRLFPLGYLTLPHLPKTGSPTPAGLVFPSRPQHFLCRVVRFGRLLPRYRCFRKALPVAV